MDGGTFGGKQFTYKPDAISFKYKWDKAGGRASFIGYLWSGEWEQKDVPSNVAYNFREPKESDRTHVDMVDRDINVLGKKMETSLGGTITSANGELVAYYEEYLDESVSDLKEKQIPFIYNEAVASGPEKINVIFASNDYFNQKVSGPNGASVGTVCNTLTIQDVKLVYYHSLKSCKYRNEDVNFDENNNAVVDGMYDEDKLALEKNGVGASVEKSYDKSSGLLTINVKGNDYETDKSSITTYTIQFAKPESVKSEREYTEDLHLRVFGEMQQPMQAKVLVQNRYDGKFNFVLKDFSLGEALPVGTINVIEIDRNGDTFAGSFTAHITGGDDNTKQWLLAGQEIPLDMKGDFVGEDHVKVGININLGSGMLVDVALGFTPAKVNMTIKEGNQYGTFYAPFAVTLPDDVKAYTCDGLQENSSELALTEVSGEIPANTAVIVENSDADKALVSQDFYNFDEDLKVENGQTGVLYGVAKEKTTYAPVGSYVLQTQDTGQKFYIVPKEITDYYMSANRCYLNLGTSATSGVKSIAFPSGVETAIDVTRELLSGKAKIYDLEGRRLVTLRKGVNIVNGKKVIVK